MILLKYLYNDKAERKMNRLQVVGLDMESYIGTKHIKACRCTANAAAKILEREINTSNADEKGRGYLVEYEGGYLSWSPAGAFENAYRKTDGLTFGLALDVLKAGGKVARAGWNGKGMYLVMQEGTTIKADQARGGAAKAISEEGVSEIVIGAHIDMRAADGSCVVGWLASQTDMLSEDWVIVD
jgi:hypothetical protein